MAAADVVLLPGLGFTGRLFENLSLPGRRCLAVEWSVPDPGEPMAEYGQRLLAPHDLETPPILIGHSFGGLVAQAIAGRRPVRGIVLVSSIKSRRENPLLFRIAACIGLHRLFTKGATLRTLRFWGGAFGYRRGAEQDLFRAMVEVQDDRFLQWALRELSRWPGPPLGLPATVHVHGTADRTFPFRRIEEPVVRVPGGTHLMIWNRGAEVSKAVVEAIGRIEGR